MIDQKRIIVVGGGPAGMMAALSASNQKGEVVLIEKNQSLGRKLLLTGNGRCNFTNAIDMDLFAGRFLHGGKFLRDAFREFTNQDLMLFFKNNGLDCVIEEDKRVFPKTNMAESILNVLRKELKRKKIKILYNKKVSGIETLNGKVQGTRLDNDEILPGNCIIFATGGISYPQTGSNGEGFEIAVSLGHKIISLLGGIIFLKVVQPYIKNLQGLTVENVGITFRAGNKKRKLDKGNILFTKNGISGPRVLSQSSEVIQWLALKEKPRVLIDFFPDVTKAELSRQFLKERSRNSKKSIKSFLKGMVPQRLVNELIKIKNISGNIEVSRISSRQKNTIVDSLKEMCFDIYDCGPIEKAMITQGGVSTKEVNPKTFESRIVKGLYFAGEMLDVDGDTGGFNLQAAFSTGHCAGKHAALAI